MDPWQPMLDKLTRLAATWPSPPWNWDARLSMVASSFARTIEPAVRASAQLAFPQGWTIKSLPTAPPTMLAIAERTGGLRSNQRLLAGDQVGETVLFGLWWPWGNGETITLRVGLANLEPASDALVRLRSVFGVSA
jgi:hypothetical protein